MSSPHPIAHSERLIVVVGPSGAGKDSVLRAWRERVMREPSHPPLHVARRTITRPADPHEGHESVGHESFARLAHEGEFATTWHANGLHYGVRRRELHGLGAGGWVVFNGSRQHLPALRRQAPHLHVVEITAPREMLARRLLARGREDADGVARRLERRLPAVAELVVCNDGPIEHAVDALHRWWRAMWPQASSSRPPPQ